MRDGPDLAVAELQKNRDLRDTDFFLAQTRDSREW